METNIYKHYNSPVIEKNHGIIKTTSQLGGISDTVGEWCVG